MFQFFTLVTNDRKISTCWRRPPAAELSSQIFIPDHNFHQPSAVLPSIFEDRSDEHVGSHVQGHSGSAPTQKQKHPSYFEKNSQCSALPKGQKKRSTDKLSRSSFSALLCVPREHSSVATPPPPLFSAPCSLIYTALMQSCAQSADETVISHINSFPQTNSIQQPTYYTSSIPPLFIPFNFLSDLLPALNDSFLKPLFINLLRHTFSDIMMDFTNKYCT